MRSTPRNSSPIVRWVGMAAVVAFAFGAVRCAINNFPEPPQAPRYVGAGDPTPRSGGTFVFGEGSNIRSLDPHYAYDSTSYAAIRLIYDGLLDYAVDGAMIPSLAKSMPTVANDGKRFVFELRKGVKFHNGRELTADDVSWSLHRLLSEAVGSPGYPFYKSISGAPAFHRGETNHVPGIEVVDRYTVAITLDEPDMTFLNAMAMPFAYPIPREVVEQVNAEAGGEGFSQSPMGAGPYAFKRWERGVQVELDRFDGYWDPKPRPDRMIYMENVDNQLLSARFRNGEIDVLYRPSKTNDIFFRNSEAWKPYIAGQLEPTIYSLVLNCGLAPFDNVHVRRAVAFAIDRRKIERLEQQRATPATQLLPPPIPGYDPDLPEAQTYDLEKAKEELKLAGHPDGLPEPVTVWVRSKKESRIVQLAQQDLQAIGIDVEIKQVTFATYLKETGKPRVAQAAFSGWPADFPDASNFMDILFHTRAIHKENSENRAFYRNPKLDTLLDKARAETDPDKRLAMYRNANAMISYDAPWAYLYYPSEIYVWQPYVKNFAVHSVWSKEYRNVWLDLPRKAAP